MKLIKASQTDQLNSIETIARQIWQEHYIPIIGQKQVDYMLDKFQSAAAMAEQIKAGRHYFIIATENDEYAGYLAYDLNYAQQQLFLSKIYVHSDFRGQGLAKQALHQIREQYKHLNILLTVNKENHIAIDFYLSQGFIKNRELVADIGNGYVMDDYEMLLTR